MKTPKQLYRKDDGQRFTKQEDGYYSMDSCSMTPPYKFAYKILISHGFVDSLDKCVIVEYVDRNDGHGNEYD